MKKPSKETKNLYRRTLDSVGRDVQEGKEASVEAYHWVRQHNWKATARLVFQRKYWGWWILLVVVIALSSVLSSYVRSPPRFYSATLDPSL